MESLHALVAAELAEPVDPRVAAMAAAIAALYPGAARAVLFYGSCLQRAAARRADARFLPDRLGLSRPPTAAAGSRSPTG